MKSDLGLTEKVFSRTVIELAKTLGWHHYHTVYAIGSDAGFPDYIFVHPEQKRVVYMELKGEKGHLSPEQWVWIETLREAGQAAEVFWPQHWDLVVAMLQGKEG